MGFLIDLHDVEQSSVAGIMPFYNQTFSLRYQNYQPQGRIKIRNCKTNELLIKSET